MFSIQFYRNKAEPNRVDKLNYITLVDTLSGELREASSIVSPTITIQKMGIPTFNYAYIPQFNRYYFIDNITSIRNDLWEISMSVDVLMSYKNAILQSTGFVDRNEYMFNEDIVDKKRVIEQGVDVFVKPISNTLFETQPTVVVNGSYIKSSNT